MANFFVIFDRQENGSQSVGGPSPTALALGSTKVLPAKVRTAETAGRWSGNVETAKIVMVEAATALEARNNVAALLGTNNTMVSVAEGNFVES